MAPLIKPSRIAPGSTIGIVAPAGPPDLERLRKGIEFLKSRGYKVKTYPQVRKRLGYLAGDDRSRADALHAAFADKSISAIFCARGGFGSLRILQDINFDIIKANPKIFVGYSDITALLLAIYKKTGMVTVHGPMPAVEFGRRLRRFTIDNFFKIIESNLPPGPIERPAGYNILRIVEGVAEGRLIGGNLSLMAKLIGTGFLPSFKNKIVFFEDTEEEAYRIDGYLSQLMAATDFAQARGYIAGEFTSTEPRFGHPPGWSVKQVVKDYFSKLNRPCIYGFPCGHGSEKVTIPIGVKTVLDADKKTVSFKEAGVR
jgi:muramoyltetrapeptide carboxypeptidase